MNAFVLLLLAYPFYLATKGRLVTYIQLASTPATAPASSGSTPTAGQQ